MQEHPPADNHEEQAPESAKEKTLAEEALGDLITQNNSLWGLVDQIAKATGQKRPRDKEEKRQVLLHAVQVLGFVAGRRQGLAGAMVHLSEGGLQIEQIIQDPELYAAVALKKQKELLKQACEKADAFGAALVAAGKSAEELGRILEEHREAIAAAERQEEKPWERNDELTQGILGLIGEDVPLEEIAGWSDTEVQEVEAYAGAAHIAASDHDDVELPPVPEVLLRRIQR